VDERDTGGLGEGEECLGIVQRPARESIKGTLGALWGSVKVTLLILQEVYEEWETTLRGL
jgi:hypothetical protein